MDIGCALEGEGAEDAVVDEEEGHGPDEALPCRRATRRMSAYMHAYIHTVNIYITVT